MESYILIFSGIIFNTIGMYGVVEYRLFKSNSYTVDGFILSYKSVLTSLRSTYYPIIVYPIGDDKQYIYCDLHSSNPDKHKVGSTVSLFVLNNNERKARAVGQLKKPLSVAMLLIGFSSMLLGLSSVLSMTSSILILMSTYLINIGIMPTIIEFDIMRKLKVESSDYLGK